MSVQRESSHDPALRTNEGIRFKGNQAERVIDALKSNELCESSPSGIHKGTTYEKIMNLRPRERGLELDGDFRFKPKSQFEKFVERVNINGTNSIPSDAMFSKHLTAPKGTRGIFLKKNLHLFGNESMK